MVQCKLMAVANENALFIFVITLDNLLFSDVV